MSAINSFLPLQLFSSGQLLRISPECNGGLILQQSHYAEFVGAGAAVGSYIDIKCTFVLAIGEVQFDVPNTYIERRQAYRRRISYIDRQQKITASQVPLERAYLIIRQLCVWLIVEQALNIPHELIAQLVGVLPKTVNLAWQKYLKEHPNLHFKSLPSCSLPTYELEYKCDSLERSLVKGAQSSENRS